MNRHERRAAAAHNPNAAIRAEAIRRALDYLAHVAAPTATGATIILPDGTTTYVSAADARALHGRTPPEVAQ